MRIRRIRNQQQYRKRGLVALIVALSITMLFSMAALTIDLGRAFVAKGELQVSADAAAMAAAWKLLDEDRILGNAQAYAVIQTARQEAVNYGIDNKVLGQATVIQPNYVNALDGDIVMGHVQDINTALFDYSDLTKYNAVLVRSIRDESRGNPLDLMFAPVFGKNHTNVSAEALAAFLDGVTGFEVTETSGNAQLLPFALQVDIWNNYLAGTYSHGDSFTYDKTSGVSSGGDGVAELNLYPGSGGTQLPPGNFGTVDIGSSNNSTKDLSRQILHGINESDLSYFGGKLELNSDGFILLNGDTGLSAGIKDELDDIKGQPRIVPLFTTVSGPGNNAMYKVVGFAGVRIVNVKLTGPMNKKEVRIQPAVVVDPTAQTTSGSEASHYVYTPVRLIR